MKALLPTYSRILGFAVMALAIISPFVMYFMGRINDGNLLFYRECVNLLVMLGALMIIFAQHKDEDTETEHMRAGAMRNGMFLTVLLIFGTMLYRVKIQNFQWMGSTSFLVYLLVVVVCLEFAVHKRRADKMFGRK